MGLLSRILNRTTAPQPTQTRRYDGAAGGRRGHGMGSFGPINAEVGAAGPQLRSRARYLASNNPFISHAVSNFAGALVGSGIVPTARHPDHGIRRDLNAYFANWTDHADATGRTDWEGLQAMVARSLIVDGEALAVRFFENDGLRVRVLPVDLLDDSKSDGQRTFSGVEIDDNGRPTAYHILPQHPASAAYVPAQRVTAEQALHVMAPVAPEQVRGVSWLAPIILPASDFDQYADALLMSAKVAAMHSGFIVNLNGTGAEPYEDSGIGGMEPGSLTRLGNGDDVRFNSPQQLQQADAFLKHNLRTLAAGLGLPTHLLDGDLTGANYSSLRAGLLPFRQRVEQIQYGCLIPQFLAPVWRDVIGFGIMNGDIAAPDFSENPNLYLRADYLPPKPMQVDPMKDIQATVAEIEAGLTSRRKAVAERGWVLDDLDAEIAAEQKEARE